MWPREAQESFLGEISSLEIWRWSPRCGQYRLKKGFLVKSRAKPKMWPREAQESFLGEISSLEIWRWSPRCVQEMLHLEALLGPILLLLVFEVGESSILKPCLGLSWPILGFEVGELCNWACQGSERPWQSWCELHPLIAFKWPFGARIERGNWPHFN